MHSSLQQNTSLAPTVFDPAIKIGKGRGKAEKTELLKLNMTGSGFASFSDSNSLRPSDSPHSIKGYKIP